MGYLIAICMINAPTIGFITIYFDTNVYEMWKLSLKCTMADVQDDFTNLSLDEIAGNRQELLGKIQKQISVAISSLEAGSDLVTNEQVRHILRQVNKNIDLIKASCNEQGIHVYNYIVIFHFTYREVKLSFLTSPVFPWGLIKLFGVCLIASEKSLFIKKINRKFRQGLHQIMLICCCWSVVVDLLWLICCCWSVVVDPLWVFQKYAFKWNNSNHVVPMDATRQIFQISKFPHSLSFVIIPWMF